MIDAGLIEALNNSIDRLNRGESVADCLRRYPQYAPQLAVLLEVGEAVKRAQAETNEAIRARERQQIRFERALNLPRRRTVTPHLLVAAALVLVFVLMSGTVLLAEGSLPGDLLYGVKLWTESVRVLLANDDPSLQAIFAARRIEEARQLAQQRRVAEMTFTGTVQAIDRTGLWIEGLLVIGENRQIPVGSRVEVMVRSTAQGELVALQIRLLDTPESTPVRRPTQNTRPTDAPTTTRIPSEAPNATASEDRSGVTDECPMPPDGWVRYSIQPGDTLSALAAASGTTIDDLVAANCIENARSIIAGQIIFLPRAIRRTSTPTPATDARSEAAPPTEAPPVIRPEPTRRSDR